MGAVDVLEIETDSGYCYRATAEDDLVEKRKTMDTPTNEFYVGLSETELFEQLQQVESELCGIHAQRAELNQQEQIAQEHRCAIQRALGCLVLEDRRKA